MTFDRFVNQPFHISTHMGLRQTGFETVGSRREQLDALIWSSGSTTIQKSIRLLL